MNVIIPTDFRQPRSYEEWESRGIEVGRAYKKTAMEIAEWWVSGKKWDRQRTAFIKSDRWHGVELKTIYNYVSIYKKFDKNSRARDGFGIRSLGAVSSLPSAQAEEMLREGRQKGWQSDDYRFEIARRKARRMVVDVDPDFTLEELIASGFRAGTILADCPWQPEHPIIRYRIGRHYKTMTEEELCALPIKELRKPTAYLHFWVPMSYLKLAFKVVESWGFEYAGSGLGWGKEGRLGPGNYWRENLELLLLGVGPKAERFFDRSLRSWLTAPRTDIHSEKPEIIRSMIERATKDEDRLELFGRHDAPGWKVWGNQKIRPNVESV